MWRLSLIPTLVIVAIFDIDTAHRLAAVTLGVYGAFYYGLHVWEAMTRDGT